MHADRREVAGQHVEGKQEAVGHVSRKCSAMWRILTHRRRMRETVKTRKKGGVRMMQFSDVAGGLLVLRPGGGEDVINHARVDRGVHFGSDDPQVH